MSGNDENYRKHLELVQLNIARMAAASFLYKSWVVATVSALFAAYAASGIELLILIAILPVFAFWVLDAFHLATEKGFRTLYEKVRSREIVNFEMKPPPTTISNWINAMWTKTLIPLYVPLLFVVIFTYILFIGDSDGTTGFFQFSFRW
ncbi:MAG: hypothetical protein AAFQ22_02440 [Pseudomonadota bacterium]